jgi:hypothetical protein
MAARAPEYLFVALLMVALYLFVRAEKLSTASSFRRIENLLNEHSAILNSLLNMQVRNEERFEEFKVTQVKNEERFEVFKITQTKNEERFAAIEAKSDERFEEFKRALNSLADVMRSEQEKNRESFLEIRTVLIEIRYHLKESDRRHDSHETRLTRLEYPEAPLKSKQV